MIKGERFHHDEHVESLNLPKLEPRDRYMQKEFTRREKSYVHPKPNHLGEGLEDLPEGF